MVLGGTLIIGSAAYLVALLDLGGMAPSGAGLSRRIGLLKAGGWFLAVVGWLVVILGTFVVAPWYRTPPPEGAVDLSPYPRSYLLADPDLAWWHRYGMEWKEYLGWIPPILLTAVAFAVARLGERLIVDRSLRLTLVAVVAVALAGASVTGLFGALLTRVAPIP
jgi:hypothetical protein